MQNYSRHLSFMRPGQQPMQGRWLRVGFYVIINPYKLAFLPTASIDKAFLVIIMQFSIDKMIKRTYNSITVYRIDVGIIAPLSCVRNQIATFGLFKDNRQHSQSAVLIIGRSHTRLFSQSRHFGKCAIAQTQLTGAPLSTNKVSTWL